MHLHTQRLKLIPFEKSESTLFLEINTSPFVRKYLWDDEIISTETTQEILVENDRLFKTKKYGLWKVLMEGNVAGYAGLWFFFDESQPQLLYALLERYAHKGIATEAADGIVRYAFNELGFSYLIAAMDEPHIESQKVAERLGMKKVETRMENDKPTVFYRIEKSSTEDQKNQSR